MLKIEKSSQINRLSYHVMIIFAALVNLKIFIPNVNCSKTFNYWSDLAFLFANLLFEIQKTGTYIQQIKGETCNAGYCYHFVNKIKIMQPQKHWSHKAASIQMFAFFWLTSVWSRWLTGHVTFAFLSLWTENGEESSWKQKLCWTGSRRSQSYKIKFVLRKQKWSHRSIRLGEVHQWRHAIFNNFWPSTPIVRRFITKALVLTS